MTEMAQDLAGVRRRFDDWRRRHGGPGRRLPEALWDAAAAVAKQGGVYETARELGLNYRRLQDRLSAGTGEGGFVELTVSPFDAVNAVVELVGRDGEQLRIHLRGTASGDLLRLVQAFWSRVA